MDINRVDIEYSVKEILLYMKQRLKLILAVALVLALLLAGYAGMTSARRASGVTDEQIQQYNESLEIYNEIAGAQPEITNTLKQQFIASNDRFQNNPIMKLDSSNCTYYTITLAFKNGDGMKNNTVENWIRQADDSRLFGDKAADLANYKLDLVHADGERGEVFVRIYEGCGFDAGAAASYLEGFLGQQANAAGEPATITSAKSTGADHMLYERQDVMRQELVRIQAEQRNFNDLTTVFNAPSPVGGESVSIGRLIKYALIGFILGLALCVIVMIYDVERKGLVLSRRQIEDGLELDNIADCTVQTSIDDIKSKIDFITGKDSKIMIVDPAGSDSAKDLTAKLKDASERTFAYGNALIPDGGEISGINDIDGIVLGITQGKSTIVGTQRMQLKAAKAGIPVLGYIWMK